MFKSFFAMLRALFMGTATVVEINMSSLVSLSNQGLLSSQASLFEDIEASNMTADRIAAAITKGKMLGLKLE